jgi:hypothetical protein
MAYFRAHPDSGVTRPDQIAIVGDRLSTDIMMANMMGSHGFWIRDGVTGRGFVSRILLMIEREFVLMKFSSREQKIGCRGFCSVGGTVHPIRCATISLSSASILRYHASSSCTIRCTLSSQRAYLNHSCASMLKGYDHDVTYTTFWALKLRIVCSYFPHALICFT